MTLIWEFKWLFLANINKEKTETEILILILILYFNPTVRMWTFREEAALLSL